VSEVARLTQEAQLLIQLVDKAAYNQRYGSYAARHPLLGKMVTCSLCGLRERRGEHQCRAKLHSPVAIGQSVFAKRRIVPRLTRKRPPLFLVHQLLVEIENDRRPDLENVAEPYLAKYIEKIVTRNKKAKAKKYRDQQKESRRTNR
jgi:hypothetical protein